MGWYTEVYIAVTGTFMLATMLVARFDRSDMMVNTAITAVFASAACFGGLLLWTDTLPDISQSGRILLLFMLAPPAVALPPTVLACYCVRGCAFNAATATPTSTLAVVEQSDVQNTSTLREALLRSHGSPLLPSIVFSDPAPVAPVQGAVCPFTLVDAFVLLVLIDGAAWIAQVNLDSGSSVWIAVLVGAWVILVFFGGMMFCCLSMLSIDGCRIERCQAVLDPPRGFSAVAAMATGVAVAAGVAISVYSAEWATGAAVAIAVAVLTITAGTAACWNDGATRSHGRGSARREGINEASTPGPAGGPSLRRQRCKERQLWKEIMSVAGLACCVAVLLAAGEMYGDRRWAASGVAQDQARALLAFKASGNGVGLWSWAGGTNPCGLVGWAGVSCSGGVVTELFMYNGVTGDVGQLAGLTQLTHLDLEGTGVSGDVGQLAGLTRLTHLSLGNTGVSGDVGQLADLTRLTNVHLEGTMVTGCPLRLTNGKSCSCNGGSC